MTIPEGVSLEEEEVDQIEALPYPDNNSRMKHYGQNVQMLIKKAAELEDGPERYQATYIADYYM